MTEELKKQEQTQPAVPAQDEVVAITVQNSKGTGTRQIFKNKKTGKLVKNVRNDERLGEDNHLRTIRDFLSSSKEKQTNDTRREAILEAIYKLVTEDNDPKTATARTNGAKFLFEHGYGKTQSDSEARSSQSPIKVVVIQQPELINSKVMREDELRGNRPSKPSFIEGEIVSENPPTNSDTSK